MPVALALLELVVLAQPRDDALGCLVLGQTDVLRRDVAGHAALEVDHGELGKTVVTADVEVHRIVAGRDLQGARAEAGLDALVGDHRHGAPDHRHDHVFADQVRVTLVAGVHGDCDVGEDRRGPNGRDRHRAFAVRERVARVRQRVVDVDVLDLEVGDRRVAFGAPVDDPVGAIHPAALVQVHEEAHHGAHVAVVHGEALALVVEGAAQAAELAHDHAAVLAQPLPDALDECLAAELLA